jgi:hypothetical protein
LHWQANAKQLYSLTGFPMIQPIKAKSSTRSQVT